MRATSSFRGTLGGKTVMKNEKTRLVYDPKADFLSEPGDENSNSDNFNVEPGKTHVLLDAEGPGVITHIWITFLGPEPQTGRRKARPTIRKCCCESTTTAIRGRPSRRPLGDFFANCFGKRSEVISMPVVRRGRRFLQLLLEDALPQVDQDRDRQREREADPPALLQRRLDQEGQDLRGHALLLRPVPAGISGRTGQGLRDPGHEGQGALRRHRAGRAHAAAPPGSAKATRKSTSTARRSRRSGAPAPKTTSSPPGD